MRSLENISIGNRIALTVAIIVIIVILLACVGYLSGRWEAEAQTQRLLPSSPPLISKYESRLLELDREAADQAYRDQIMHLFQTWMKDEREQPVRALVGARQARSAYERVMNAIEERERLKDTR
jgi:uncharacterized protein YneF (UPF0154 family)